jgi:hypothetical protein
MSKPLPFTQASIRRAVAAAQSAGLVVTGIAANGTVLTGDNAAIAVPGSNRNGQSDPYAIAAERVNAKTKRKRNRALA